jgi:hypothetical protein
MPAVNQARGNVDGPHSESANIEDTRATKILGYGKLLDPFAQAFDHADSLDAANFSIQNYCGL